MNTQLNTRIQIKIDTENAWNLVSTTFVPLSGEMCIYRMNDGSIRSKIGDGTTAVGSLAFDDEAVRGLISTLSGTVSSLNTQVTELDTAVGNFQTSLNSKVDSNNGVMTGVPTAPTASKGTNTTQIATTAFVQEALSSVGGGGTTVFVQSGTPSGAKTGDLWYKIL